MSKNMPLFRAAARPLLIALATGVLAGCAHPQTAETARAKPLAAPSSTLAADAGPVQKLAAALASADQAEAAGDTDALSRAVRIIDGLGGHPLADLKLAEASSNDPLPAWRAQTYGDEIPMRGRPLGPGYRKGTVGAGGAERIEQLFLSGQRANVALSGPGKARLELKVEDAKNSSVCARGIAPSHCDWVPIFTQRYVIEITNPGDKPAHYFLVVE